MGGSLFGNIYVFVAWRGKDNVSESEQTTLAILLAAVSFSGVLILLLKTDFQICKRTTRSKDIHSFFVQAITFENSIKSKRYQYQSRISQHQKKCWNQLGMYAKTTKSNLWCSPWHFLDSKWVFGNQFFQLA